MRKVGNALFGALTLGDVLLCGKPTAAEQRLVYDQYRTPISGFDDVASDIPQRYVAQDGRTKTFNVALERASLLSIRDKIAKAEAGLYDIGRKPVHLKIAPIADDQPFQ